MINKYPHERLYLQLENLAGFSALKRRLLEARTVGILRYQRKVASETQRYLFVEDCLVFERLFGEVVAVDVARRATYWIVLLRFADRTIAHLEFCAGDVEAVNVEWNGVHQLLVFDSELQQGFKVSGGENYALRVVPKVFCEREAIEADFRRWQGYLFGEDE
ncbi:hypothetical protein [Fundicoccus culcitae]|uniref:Uncharacterized protein n=1 Tax=Fundicoccus culcitae TaxID=2969821 RepID=A0ABY5P9L0_9LACT|nr:hypothetical protein [Fundicoccus culcitae]UUX35038.1 hypothetical protein NRE15_05185 [Fundicoccus culcitae]